jgi:hypothetical protein
MQFAENIKTNSEEGYYFIMTMPDHIQLEQPSREFKNCSGNFFEHPPYSAELAPSDFHLFRPLKKNLGGKRFTVEEDETEVRK